MKPQKVNMKKSLNKLFLIIVFSIITITVYPQGPGGGPGPGGPGSGPPNPVGLPIDGGAIFLLSSGLIYAINKLRKKEE